MDSPGDRHHAARQQRRLTGTVCQVCRAVVPSAQYANHLAECWTAHMNAAQTHNRRQFDGAYLHALLATSAPYTPDPVLLQARMDCYRRPS